MSSTRVRRISLTDRLWEDFVNVISVSPVAAPDLASVREYITHWWRVYPNAPALCAIDTDTHRWVPVAPDRWPAHLERMVRAEPDGARHEHPTTMLADGFAADLPLQILLGQDRVTLVVSHALGDARAVLPLFSAITLLSPSIAGHLERQPTGTKQLLRILAGHYTRHPSQAAAVLPALNSAWQGMGLTTGDISLVPPNTLYHTTVISPDQMRRLRDLRDAIQPRVSMATMASAATVRAFAACGIDTGPGFHTMVDNRRYGQGPATASSNLSNGIYLTPSDPRNPVAIQQALDAALASGHSLEAATLGMVRAIYRFSRARTRPAALPIGPATEPLVESGQIGLCLSHVGRIPFTELPWLAGVGQRTVVTTAMSHSAGIGIVFGELDGELHFTTRSVSARHGVGAIEAALHLLTTPVRAGTAQLVAPGP